MKRCNKCGNEKPLDDFAICRGSKDGRQITCRACKREHYLANKERYQARHRAWREANPGRNAELAREWRQANPERAAQGVRRWNQENPERALERSRRRRARRQEATVESFTADELLASWAERGLSGCTYCPDGEYEHADHVVPLARGGSHSIDNLVPACERCNTSKGAKLLADWLPAHQARLAASA